MPLLDVKSIKSKDFVSTTQKYAGQCIHQNTIYTTSEIALLPGWAPFWELFVSGR
jgi:hypothetical protein